ncbi:MAG: right-handed parallel beta-helix repeat-containing protein [Methanothrix sp.]|jgi:parallel beta-helix repeat protein|uniref:Cell surface protein n=1 Tax=Methanothrix harundinacea TaxID=301375 RepID=A0A124G384_9EURY|nr:MAG: Cell surface protein [Methanothrix harundinacea]KUK96132.1 MAG: Cell surface protein [Methanothrix harundinacea]MDD3710888.1 NosD domain-containing protein [Methanothrix sp.]MDD5767340.1 NosD domain-containing protein [Methanothrix sp.]MDI9399941.1 NosD domain-containing protein [Euryarchaeota archaeon]
MGRFAVESIILLIAFCSLSQAATITVGEKGCDFYRIEAALDSANPDDVIEVHSGEYWVNLNITTPFLTLRGNDTGGGTPVLRAGSSTAEIERTSPGLTEMVEMSGGTAVAIRADFVTVESFVITGVTWPIPYDTGEHRDAIGHAGIKVYSDFNKIANNTFVGNDLTAIGLMNASNNQIIGNTIKDVSFGYAMNLYNSHANNIEKNTIVQNDWGIELQRSDSNTITENEICESANDGIWAVNSNYTMITENIISRNGIESKYEGNGKGISLVGSEGLIANNVISFNRDHGIYIQSIFWEYCSEPPCGAEESYENLVIGNRIQGNGRDGVRLEKTWRNNVIDNNITSNHGNGISFIQSHNNTADLNNVTRSDHGIFLDRSNYTKVNNNTIAEGEKTGILFWSTIGASAYNNTILDSPVGVSVEESSSGLAITENRIRNATEGMNISGGSRENQVTGNNVSSSDVGVILVGATRNLITGNVIFDSILGIVADFASRGNSIYGNDLSGNGEAARDEGDNLWDDGSRGNYYGPGSCADGDGVCEGSRSIPGGKNVDRFPLARRAGP